MYYFQVILSSSNREIKLAFSIVIDTTAIMLHTFGLHTFRKTLDQAIGECRLQNSILCALIKTRSVQ